MLHYFSFLISSAALPRSTELMTCSFSDTNQRMYEAIASNNVAAKVVIRPVTIVVLVSSVKAHLGGRIC